MDKVEQIYELIEKYQSCFRILDKWKIYCQEHDIYKNQCTHNSKTKKACIYTCDDDIDIDDYVYHEILHICQCEMRSGKYEEKREKEELFIINICDSYKSDKLNNLKNQN